MGVKSVGIIAGQNVPTIISPVNYKIRSAQLNSQRTQATERHRSRAPVHIFPRCSSRASRLLLVFRFRSAMERYFMVSPAHSSRLTLLAQTNTDADKNSEKQ